MRGTVVRFDRDSGLGEICDDDGVTYPFHATVIADGSRAVEVGATVSFEVVPGHLGRWEAAGISYS